MFGLFVCRQLLSAGSSHSQTRVLITSWLIALCLMANFATSAQADPNYDAGIQFYKSGNFTAASQSFARVDLPAKQATVLYYQALCNQQLGRGTAALKLYRQVATSYPNSQEARLAAQYLEKFSGHSSGPGALADGTVTPGPPLSSPGAPSREMAMTGEVPSFKSPAIGKEILPDTCGVPFHRTQGNHMLMNATVGGRQMEVMFDTGAASCYFGRDQLEQAGAKVISTGQKSASRGVGGVQEVELCIAEIKLGDIVRTVPVMVAPKGAMTPLLGENFFNPFRYDIDTSAGIVHFHKLGGGSHEAFDTMNVPFTKVGNELEVTCSIDGHQTTAYFDTGAYCTLFPMQLIQSMGINIPRDATPMMVSGVGGGSLAFRFRVDRFALGPVQKSNMEITVSPSCPIALIGQDFFKDKRFTIDNEAHMIKFTH